MRPKDTLHNRWGCDSALYLGMGKPSFRAGKICLRIQIRQLYTRLSFLLRVNPWLSTAEVQSCRLWLILGHCMCEFSLLRSLFWLLPSSPLFSFTVRFAVIKPHICPYNPHGIREEIPAMSLKILREAGSLLLPRLSFTIGRTRGSGENCPCGAMLAWAKGNAVNV